MKEEELVFTFTPFTLVPHERALWCAETSIPLPGKLFDILHILVSNHDRLVSRQEMMQSVWANTRVEPGNLTQNVYVIRQTLKLWAPGREFIETVPGRGYRFTASIQRLPSAAVAGKRPASPPAAPPVSPPESNIALVAAAIRKSTYFIGLATPDSLFKALGLLLAILPYHLSNAQLHSHAGYVHALSPQLTGLAASEHFASAESLAKKALQIDRGSFEALATLGIVDHLHHWNWRRAGELFEESLTLQPSFAATHAAYAVWLMGHARLGVAEREMSIAVDLDPLSVMYRSGLAEVHLLQGNLEAAETQTREALQLSPESPLAWLRLGTTKEARRSYEEAILIYRHLAQITNDGAPALSMLAHANAMAGYKTRAEVLLEKVQAAPDLQSAYYDSAVAYCALGNTGRSIQNLEHACERRDPKLVLLSVDPRIRPLAANRRFQEIVRSVIEEK